MIISVQSSFEIVGHTDSELSYREIAGQMSKSSITIEELNNRVAAMLSTVIKQSSPDQAIVIEISTRDWR